MVVNIGSGEKEKEMERCDMAEDSMNSQKKGEPSTKKTKQPITREEACQLLASAISYCNEAGFVVTGKNHELSLRLQIEGMNYIDGDFVVTSENVTTKPDVTTKENVVTEKVT